jgi:hypothetical protein
MNISTFKSTITKICLIFFFSSFIISCSNIKTRTGETDIDNIIYHPRERYERKKIAKEGSFVSDLFLGSSKQNSNSGMGVLPVNQYLWKASLEILSGTIPLSSVDSNSGLIISDWYNLKGKSNERVKISILVSSQELRADGLKVSIFKQVNRGSAWQNAKINPKIILNLERKIIQKAGVLSSQSN